MTHAFPDLSPSARGRILAAIFLVVTVGGIVGQAFILDRMIDPGDATKTAANIVADPSRYRLAYTIFMVEMVAQVVLSLMFYDLLKPVSRSLARIAAVIGVVGAGIKTFARVFHYSPLILLGGAPYLSALEPAQLSALSLAFVKIGTQGTAIALIFFGFETLLLGWLIFNSEFLPRALGVLTMLGGVGWLTYLWPPLGAQAFMFVALFALVGVVVTTGWLFVRGVDDVKWRRRAELSAASLWR